MFNLSVMYFFNNSFEEMINVERLNWKYFQKKLIMK